jgi:hypothetical protein
MTTEYEYLNKEGNRVIVRNDYASPYGQRPHVNAYVYRPSGVRSANIHVYYRTSG